MKTKKILSILLVALLIGVFLGGSISHARSRSSLYDKLTKNQDSIIVTPSGDNPIVEWSYQAGSGVNGLYMGSERLLSFLDAKNAALAYAQNIINWTLLLVGLVALIYLLYAGFQMLTASWDETKFKKWFKDLRSATIAILWIALSAVFINFVLYVIDRVVL